MNSPQPKRNAPVWVPIVLIVIAIVTIVVGIIYFAEAGHSLPTWFPGYGKHIHRHHTKRAIALVVIGALALIGAWLTSGRKRTKTT